MKSKFLLYGTILFLIGIYQAVSILEPHFYSAFSLGLLFISLYIYEKISGRSLFYKWKKSNILYFFISILILSIIIDFLGLKLGYWDYPYYYSLFDDILKYVFEWVTPLIVYMIIFMIGVKVYLKSSKPFLAVLFSLITFVLVIGIFTEYINSFVDSWRILKMPILDYSIGVFNVGFVTMGYWLMALITYRVYLFFEVRR